MQEEEPAVDILKLNDEMIKKQIDRIKNFKNIRDNEKVSSARQHLESVATGNDNIMPAIINCVKNNVSLGEIADSLRSVFGSHTEGF
jgi:methylmalonyl-CoA mutase N-terminal domain/subunit